MIEDRYRKYNENEEEFSKEEHELMRKGSFENNAIKPKKKKKSIDLNNLNFNNFKSFLPLPRKEDQLWKFQGQKMLNY